MQAKLIFGNSKRKKILKYLILFITITYPIKYSVNQLRIILFRASNHQRLNSR